MVIWSHIRDALFELDALRRYRTLHRFTTIDWSLKKRDLVSNSYSQCRKYFGKEAAEGIYGETPLQTIESILRVIGVTEKDTFVDLGCGRGRLCFFVNALFGCTAKGIDLVPSYIREAKKHPVEGTEFYLDDYKNHLDQKAIYYWYVVTSNSSEFLNVVDLFCEGAIVITISERIEGWELLHTIPALYPWGETYAFVQRKQYGRAQQKKV